MRVDNFIQMFNQIVVCRPFPDRHFGVEYECVWKPTVSFLPTRSKSILM
jgi:hypothetical protein